MDNSRGPPAKRVKLEGDANMFDTPESYGDFANSLDSSMGHTNQTNQNTSQGYYPSAPSPQRQQPSGAPKIAPHTAHTHTPSKLATSYPPYQGAPTNVPQNYGVSTPTAASNSATANASDPNKLNDALAAAGVNIAEEEEISQNLNSRASYGPGYRGPQALKSARISPFLNPYQLAQFMTRVAKENGIHQNFQTDSEMLDLMSAACETWMSQLITRTLILSHHRRRGIANFNGDAKGKKAATAPRSELSRELRNMAVRQKESEEKRVLKRIALGLEKDAHAPEGDAKGAAAEEAMHRSTNATAAMMTTGKKKYAWMDGGGGEKSSASTTNSGDKNKQSALITARGDNGLRYREIRSGNSVMMKDLLSALEDERQGADKALLKGYAKLKE
ncbi:transcription initiation factor TFIID subunit 4 [Diutina catenulata]